MPPPVKERTSRFLDIRDPAKSVGLWSHRAVLAAYGLASDTPEPEIVAHLFKLYAEKVSRSR